MISLVLLCNADNEAMQVTLLSFNLVMNGDALVVVKMLWSKFGHWHCLYFDRMLCFSCLLVAVKHENSGYGRSRIYWLPPGG